MQDITVDELKQRMDKNEDLVVIDVREPFEYDEFNIGAQNIPMGEIPHRLAELEPYKEQEVILHCKSGGRSGNVKTFLLQQGFSNVRNLLGGMEEWKQKFS